MPARLATLSLGSTGYSSRSIAATCLAYDHLRRTRQSAPEVTCG